MSRTWVLSISDTLVRVYVSGSPAAVAELPWQADVPDTTVRALQALPGQPSQLVLMVGLAWLDAVPLTLPPVPVAQQRLMLQVDADRWFPFSSAPAVAIAGPVAMAMPGETVASWVRALRVIAPVDAVVTLPQAAALAGVDGTWQTVAGVGETGLLELVRGTLRHVRRTRHPAPTPSPTLDEGACAQAVLQAGTLSLDHQLLDAVVERAVRARRRGVWWRAMGMAVAAAAFCLWSVDQWRARALVESRSRRDALAVTAQAAMDADERRQRAADERTLLLGATTHPQLSAVLAMLGERLPSDVVVQRAEWDGTQWRLDGSARDAAPLVPLLAGLKGVQDVRTLAPSTRFLDGGQQRSSFAIAFRLADPTVGRTP